MRKQYSGLCGNVLRLRLGNVKDEQEALATSRNVGVAPKPVKGDSLLYNQILSEIVQDARAVCVCACNMASCCKTGSCAGGSPV